ncbi:MAG: T9SS type A sorting domain-containing protein [candidate division Zixibacteria bacterium]|nr:T9SS type A sorting domain-containing protein [candidate division Zixibacteria bacterium]
MERHEVESPIEIQLSGDFDEITREGNLDMTLIAHEQINHAGLVVMIALTEDSLFYQGSNGTLWHNKTMRDIIPDTLGITLNISQGETVEISQAFSCPDPLVIDKCELVAWVQANPDDRDILQTSKILVSALGPVSIDGLVETPSDFAISHNYPNPFNAQTTISYSLNEPSVVKVEIIDLLGQEVETIFLGKQQAGEHRVNWNAENISSGIYFYKIQAGEKSETRKMILLK